MCLRCPTKRISVNDTAEMELFTKQEIFTEHYYSALCKVLLFNDMVQT